LGGESFSYTVYGMDIGIPAVLSLLAGVILMGVATMRAQVYYTWAGVPFILALILLPLQLIHEDLAIIAIVAASVGFVWLGGEVWSRRPRFGHAATVI
jgi:hypothetical protein